MEDRGGANGSEDDGGARRDGGTRWRQRNIGLRLHGAARGMDQTKLESEGRGTPVKPEGVRSQGGVDGSKGQVGVLAWKFKVEQKGHESQDIVVAH